MVPQADGSSQVLWEDGERIVRRGWRVDDNGKRRAVLTILPAADSRASLERLSHEYQLKEELDASWALRPLELVSHAGRTMLVFEDVGAEPLDRQLGAPMEVGRFLSLAVSIAEGLGRLHQQGLVHKDIKPANILVDPVTNDVRLTGFGIASRLARERQSPQPPETIAGTLAYMAPEQTGRMNRSIDSRSDLYALGVTFYQMLTGALPFTAADPIEWVHCHIARRPMTPAERLNDIPAVVSAIVMKLLAKLAEDRYQTAAGLESDLRICLSQWAAQRRIDDFPLGGHDTPDRLLIPEKLYGRRREVESLLAAFDRVARGGAPELVLVSGYPGVGKSSVVNELQKVLLASTGLFASGKFDQNKRDIPFATFAQAFQRLVGMILAEPEAEHVRYRDAILVAVQPYGQFIVNLAPEVERLIGKQPPISEVAPQDALRVFQQVLRRFIGVFARPEHPLVLFLDDLQWLDTATLDVLQHLLLQEEVKSLLLVGAYRDNEVGPEHPLARRLEAIRRAGAPVSEIRLGPLALPDLRAMIAETLHYADVLPLAELVHNKTAGNPLFASQFLTALKDDGLITFEPGMRRWMWDEASIASRSFTDNVVDLMIEKITRLPAPCREVMRVMACIGNTVRADTLAAALDATVSDVHAALRHAVDAGLVTLQSGAYTVLHDRIQEASYASIAEAERPSVHLNVGRRLLASMPLEKFGENLFEIVNQLNRGIVLVSDRDELDRIAELNAKAGQRAKAATAIDTALALFRTGAAVLGDSGWLRRRALAFRLAFEQAECQFLMGDLEQAEAQLSDLVATAEGPRECAAVACLRIMLYVTRGEPARSIEVCLKYLESEGIHFTPHPSREDVENEFERMWRALGDRSIEDLARLPETTDPTILATLDVLAAAASPAWFTDQLLPALIGARIANISIEHGNGPASSFGYSMLGMKLGPFSGDYRTAYRFGKVALELAERGSNPRTLARVLFGYTMFTRPWADDLSGCRELLERGFEAAERAGDVTYATYLLYHVEELMLIAGSPLEETEAACRRALSYARKLNFDFAVLQIQPQLALTRMLRGDSVRFGSFDSAEFDQDIFERTCSGVPALTSPLCRYWFRRQQAHFLAGDARASVAAADAAGPLLWCADVFPQFADYHFYGALACAECLDSPDEGAQPNLRERLEAHLTKLAQFGENSPVTFGSRAALGAAELARIEGRELDAMTLYEQAIRSARAAGFAHIEALSFELAARFYAARGFETIATSHRREARAAYLRWGAHGKVRQLEQLFPELRDQVHISGTTTFNAPVEQLDLATVIKVSQTISGEIVLEKLLDTLMRTAIEHAGATRAVLLLSAKAEHRIVAEAATNVDAVVVRLLNDSVTASVLPETVFRYVLHTQESVIIDDATIMNPFSTDPYIGQRRAYSILCLPLLNQAKLIGVLYLENNLAPRVFSPGRTAVLKLIASQAAISIENTRLYRDLAEREARIRRLIDADIIGIFFWDFDGRITDANDSFLKMIGYDRHDISRGLLRWTDLTPEEWRIADEGHFANLRESGTAQPHEKELFRKDGSRVPILMGSAMFDPARNQGVAFVLDQSDRKRAEEAARESEKRYQQIQADFAHATRVSMLGELTASIAHEVNQPLGAIMASGEATLRWLARPVPEVDEVRELTRKVVADARRASEIVGRIRAMATRREPAQALLSLDDIIREALQFLRHELESRGASVSHFPASAPYKVIADRTQLQQVVVNLAVNAVQAMTHAECPNRKISIRTVARDPGTLHCSVEDSGPGIEPRNVTRLFDSFFTTKEGGMGMGLRICRSIIERHGGEIAGDNASSYGGARFFFTLPIARADSDQTASYPAAAR